MKKNTTLVIAIIILLLAMGLRLNHITDFPLWTDEGWTIWYVETQSAIETIERLFSNRHPPLYFVSLSLWQNVAGNSHLSLRFLAVLSGILTTAFVYRIAADAFNKKTGLYAALLFAVLDISIYYSQEVRHYSWLTMMAVITSALFLRYIRRPHRSIGLAYLLSVTAIMLTHYFGLFILIVQAIYGVFFWRTGLKQKRNLIVIWVDSLILYLPWMIVVISTLSMITRGVGNFPGSFNSTLPDLIAMLNLFFDRQIALLGGVYLIGVLNLYRRKLPQLYVAVSGGGLFIIMWFLNYQVGVLSARMIYYLTPFLVIICAYGLVQINTRIAVVLTAAFLFTAFIDNPVIQPRLNLPEMTAQIESEYVAGDLIVIETGWTDFATEYEIKQAIPQSIPTLFATARIWNPDLIVKDADSILADYDTVWLVQWLHAPVVLPRLLDGWHDFELVASYEIENHEPVAVPDPIRIYRFQRPQLDNQPLIFGNKIELHDAIFPDELSPSDSLHIDLWWQTDEALQRDYSSGIFLMDASGQVVTQLDTALAETPSSQWQAGDFIHVSRSVQIPETLPTGEYTLNIVAYYFEDPANPLAVDGQPFISLGTLTIGN